MPYTLFQDKKMTSSGVGIETDIQDFDDYFLRAQRTYADVRGAKTLQQGYIELFSEKDLPLPVEELLEKYEIGLVSSGGFAGDVGLHNMIQRLIEIQEIHDLPIRFYCLGDYDAEGEHIVSLIKDRCKPYGIHVEKLAITKRQVKKFNLISNIGYRDKMMKPKTLKAHLKKRYVKEFFESNKDLAADGICQFELEALETSFLIDLIEHTISSYINLDIIKNRRKILDAEVEIWLAEHYKE